MAKFNVGDIIYKDEVSVLYTVENIDYVSSSIPKYKLVQGDFSFWDYCAGWKKLVTPDDALRYGEVLTDDEIHCFPNGKEGWVRIRTIRYDERIFYYKMVDGEVVKFKELTT